ncbi:MAG: gamma-glutamyltranspeptidase/glutathione hydrolase [Candidatus Paceibacteria bacterium]|jgi:gamma-glutamyltranspeptidase/glutathione hydrolase
MNTRVRHGFLIATLFAILSACGVSSSAAPASDIEPAVGEHGMVSTAHPIATEAGLSILRRGGNAFDAAVAIAATLNVVESMMSGMGGYGTILVFDAEKGEAHYLDASGKIPMAVDADVYRAPTPNYMENRRNAKAVSTPGAVNAWAAMSERFGSLPWKELFDPAIRAATDGVAIDEREARWIASAFPEFPEHARAIFGKDGAPLGAGDRLVQNDLAGSLGLIAKQGAAALYGGPLGEAIDKAMKEAGGFLSAQDLTADRAEWWQPISTTYRGFEVVTPSAPAGAFPMLVRLGMMGQEDNRALGHNSLAYLHRFAEVTKHAYWTRLAYSGDPDVKPPPYDRLLSQSYWQEQTAKLDLEHATEFDYAGIVSSSEGKNTTHFVVADKHGNVVSATVTLGNLFGSRIMPKGTGFWLNNSLAYCTYEPAGNPMDAHPGRRKLSSDSPTFVLKDGAPWVALGTPGGHTITQTCAQMVMNVIDFDMDIQAAIAAPRIAFNEPNYLEVEATIPEATRAALQALGHHLRVRNLGNAHGLMIEYDSDGKPKKFIGGTDPRGAGLAEGY